MDVFELRDKYDALAERIHGHIPTLQKAIPLTRRSAKAQEAFLLAFGDFQLLQQLYPAMYSYFDGFAPAPPPEELPFDEDSPPPPPKQAPGSLYDNIVEQLAADFGISPNIIQPTVLKQIALHFETLEAIVTRFEANIALLQAG